MSGSQGVGIATLIFRYFFRYFSSTSTEQISPDSAGRFTSFDPVGFAIFIRESFLQSAQEPVGGTAEQFSRLIHDDFEKYGRLVKDLKIKAN